MLHAEQLDIRRQFAGLGRAVVTQVVEKPFSELTFEELRAWVPPTERFNISATKVLEFLNISY